jgi:hypothetical protein
LEYVANRLYELVGWHVELYVDSRFLSELFSLLVRLPAVSIDHLGLSEEGFPLLLKLVEKGIRVKATGFGRVNLRVEKAIRSICEVNPDALMFGTDLPSTRAKRPFQDTDLDIIFNTLDEKLAEKVLFQNAVDWYRPSGCCFDSDPFLHQIEQKGEPFFGKPEMINGNSGQPHQQREQFGQKSGIHIQFDMPSHQFVQTVRYILQPGKTLKPSPLDIDPDSPDSALMKPDDVFFRNIMRQLCDTNKGWAERFQSLHQITLVKTLEGSGYNRSPNHIPFFCSF